MPLAFFQNVGGAELLWIVLIIAVLFGAKRIPDVARALGRSIGEFKKGKAEAEREAEEEQRKGKKSPSPYDQDERSGSHGDEKGSP